MRRWTPLSLLVVATAAVAPLAQPVLGQSRERGWIGISYEVRSAGSAGSAGAAGWRDASVVITDVRRGSPAAQAGLREGDLLVRINDIRRAEEFQNLPERLRLRVGDQVRIRVERAGRDMTFRLRAAERPRELTAERTQPLTLHTDSIAESMFQAMDSLRLQLVETRGRSVRVATAPAARAGEIRIASGDTREAARGAAWAPFEFFVFRGEEHDSLRREMDELTQLITDLRSRERARIREIRRVRSGGDRSEARDGQLQSLRGAIEDLTRRAATLRTAMAGAARATAGLEYEIDLEPLPPVPSDEEVRAFRPLTPYLLGSNRVAGAHVVDLRPQLAEYFQVDGGVLIVDVAPGTPAAIAGIVPGDVITRLDQVSVRTVEDLRFGVSRAGETLPLRLVRRGSTVEVLLRR